MDLFPLPSSFLLFVSSADSRNSFEFPSRIPCGFLCSRICPFPFFSPPCSPSLSFPSLLSKLCPVRTSLIFAAFVLNLHVVHLFIFHFRRSASFCAFINFCPRAKIFSSCIRLRFQTSPLVSEALSRSISTRRTNFPSCRGYSPSDPESYNFVPMGPTKFYFFFSSAPISLPILCRSPSAFFFVTSPSLPNQSACPLFFPWNSPCPFWLRNRNPF